MANQFLPEFAAVKHPEDGSWVLITRGERGYRDWPAEKLGDPELFNAELDVSEAQQQAMLAGSMFGFDAPIADPMLHLKD